MPVYKTIADLIQRNILNGVYDQSRKLPTEDDLCHQYETSKTTLRKAISILVNKGFVYPVQGSGYFIRDTARKDYINLGSLNGLSREFQQRKVESVTLELYTVQADADLADQFECDPGTDLIFVKRLRKVSDEPFAVEYSYYNKEIIPYLSEEITDDSVYRYIAQDLKLSIGFADRILSAQKLDAADAALLDLHKEDPALVMENRVFLSNGKIFEVSKVVHHYQHARMMNLANWL